MTINKRVAQTYHLAAAPFLDKILVFGGAHNAEFYMALYNQEGGLIGDLSKVPNIPLYMCCGCFT